MFGLAGNWKRRRPARLERLAAAIEALGDRDQRQADENSRIDRLRLEGSVALYEICREFAQTVNERLSSPALVLDPRDFDASHFQDPGTNLFQINLRGRLLMLEFESTEEPLSTDDFRRAYILHGSIRGLNQDLIEHNMMSEKSIFFCPSGESGHWYFVDHKSYRSGRLNPDLLADELQRLL